MYSIIKKKSQDKKFASGNSIFRHLPELLSLALPIILSRTGVLLMITADTVMLGRYSTRELAVFNIGTVYVIPLLVISLGLLMGTLVMTVSAYSQGHFQDCGGIWRKSIPYALILSFAIIFISMFGEDILLLSKQTPDLAKDGGQVMLIMAFGIPAYLIFLTTAFFLEGIKRPVPVMIVMVFANFLNFFLNWVFIFGNFGVSEMGADGAVLATSLSRWFLSIVLVVYVLYMPDYNKFAVRIRPTGGWQSWVKQRRIGYAIGISVGVETMAFAIVNIFAGWLGETSLAIFSIVFNLIAIVFMAALGIGAATAIKVGFAYGQRHYDEMATCGWTGLGLNSLFMIVVGLTMWVFAKNIANFYTNDLELITLTSPLIALAAFILIFDGGQVVMNNALRGRQDVWIPSLFQTFNFLVLMVPLSWFLTFQMGYGAEGLILGILYASIVAVIILSARFYVMSKTNNT